jgi:short-subunit dehydrogenase
MPLSAFYHGSKFALKGLSESIQYELEPFGIKIILIEPGAVGSNFWKNIRIAEDASTSSDSPYGLLASSMSKAFEKMEKNAIHPSEDAKTILAAVTSDNPHLRYVVGNDATSMMKARKNKSDGEFGDLIKKQFNL